MKIISKPTNPMKKETKIKNFWAEIYVSPNKSKTVFFDTMEQGQEYLQKVGKPNAPIHDINKELPF